MPTKINSNKRCLFQMMQCLTNRVGDYNLPVASHEIFIIVRGHVLHGWVICGDLRYVYKQCHFSLIYSLMYFGTDGCSHIFLLFFSYL